jgi:hypothetical protein
VRAILEPGCLDRTQGRVLVTFASAGILREEPKFGRREFGAGREAGDAEAWTVEGR